MLYTSASHEETRCVYYWSDGLIRIRCIDSKR